ncbi:MAG: hypothetical protein BZ151_04580 [Desulfobacca sp. 4484_104]|nr:MAG: hypothetical protein BZ151_04580 [Desulfobacca sp. 4484_104]
MLMKVRLNKMLCLAKAGFKRVFPRKLTLPPPAKRTSGFMPHSSVPWHNGRLVQQALAANRLREHRLPPYRPKMNACEYFIRWAKSILSYNWCWKSLDRCWKSLDKLKFCFRGFIASLSKIPSEVLKRCTPQMIGFNVV